MALLSQLSDDDPQNYQPTPPYTPAAPAPLPAINWSQEANKGFVAPAGPKGAGAGAGNDLGGGFPSFDIGNAPGFKGLPAFQLPDAAGLLNSQGYKFREQQGRDALEHSAAAKGLLRTGGTLKDLASWNQDYASQEYDSEARRQLGAWQTNYQQEKDKFAPQFANWQFLSNAALQKALAVYGRGTAWNNPHQGGGGGGYQVPDPEPVFGG